MTNARVEREVAQALGVHSAIRPRTIPDDLVRSVRRRAEARAARRRLRARQAGRAAIRRFI